MSLSTCILTTDGRPERRAGNPDTRLMRYERRAPQKAMADWDRITAAFDATDESILASAADVSDLGSWDYWSAAAIRAEAQNDHQRAREDRLRAVAARMRFLSGNGPEPLL